MKPGDPLGRLLPKRLRALVRNLPSARKGNVKALHRTRVASRRVREALPILEICLAPNRLRKARRQTRRLTRTLGSVRELDVALAILGETEPARPQQAIALDRVREHMTREREARRKEMVGRLHSLKPNKVARKIAGLVESLAETKHLNGDLRVTLGKRAQDRGQRLRQAIITAGTVYLPDQLHMVRIGLKKLRYALELVREGGIRDTDAEVKTLKRAQDTLGRLHDIQVLIQHVQEVNASLPLKDASLQDDLDDLARILDAECRDLHAQYVARREELLRICNDAMKPRARRAALPTIRPSIAAERRRRSRAERPASKPTRRKAS